MQTLHAAAACPEFQFSREETETGTVICIELEINLPLTTGMCNRIFSDTIWRAERCTIYISTEYFYVETNNGGDANAEFQSIQCKQAEQKEYYLNTSFSFY